MDKSAKCSHKRNSVDFNEFYTLYEEADKFLTPYLSYINKAKTIYCPCDSEESNIVKWLKDHCNATILYQHEKDFNSEEIRNEMLKADIIITNPPFAMKILRPFVNFLLDHNKDFILWCPNSGAFFNVAYYFDFQRSNMHPYLNKRGEIKYAMSRLMSSFYVPHGFTPNKEYDLSCMPYTAVWFFNKNDYECIGKVPSDGFARVGLKRKEDKYE